MRKREPGGVLGNEDEEEAAVAVKRVPAVTLQIWESMLGPRGFELQHGKLIRSPSKSQNPPVKLSDEDSPSRTKGKGKAIDRGEPADDLAVPQQQSALASYRRTHLHTVHSKDASSSRLFQRGPVAHNIPEIRAPSEELLAEHPAALPKPVPNSRTPDRDSEEAGERVEGARLFSGRTFWILGEARCARVRTALEQAGGRILGEASDDHVDFIIVRLVR